RNHRTLPRKTVPPAAFGLPLPGPGLGPLARFGRGRTDPRLPAEPVLPLPAPAPGAGFSLAAYRPAPAAKARVVSHRPADQPALLTGISSFPHPGVVNLPLPVPLRRTRRRAGVGKTFPGALLFSAGVSSVAWCPAQP